MTSSDHTPSPLSEYGVKEEPFIEYALSPLTRPWDYYHSATSPPQCDHHHGRTICCIPPVPHPLFPSHHNLVASTKHNIINKDCDTEFLRVIIHSTIVFLERKPGTSRSTLFLSPRTSLYLKWRSYFPASCPLHPPCDYVNIQFGSFYMSNHTDMHMYVDVIICWLHWLYDYT